MQLSWGIPGAESQPGLGFGALDSPLPACFAVSVAAAEKSSGACTVLLLQAREAQHSLQGETPKPSLLQKSVSRWIVHTCTYQMLGDVPLKRERSSHKTQPDSSVNVAVTCYNQVEMFGLFSALDHIKEINIYGCSSARLPGFFWREIPGR